MDLRAFIESLSNAGRLMRVSREVDWKFELGEIVRSQRSPILFQNVKGYPGSCVFANGLSSVAEVGLALGMSVSSNKREIVLELKRRKSLRLEPKMVGTSPAFENIWSGDEIDLLRFPVPHWNRQDRGRYIGTWHVNVSKDPETGARNVGVYRMELLGPRQTTVSTTSGSHLGMHLTKAEQQGRPLEMAVAIGTSEVVVMAGSAACPYGVDEYELAGALQQESIQLIQCRTVNLEVPAESEIVIEGVIKPGVRVLDGPYFDYVGKPSVNPQAYLFEATRVMSRRNPIFRGASIGMPGAEDQNLLAALASMDLWDFHGSRSKRWLQSYFLRNEMFKAFQLAGRIRVR